MGKHENVQIELINQLQQKGIAAECATWIQDRVDIKSVKRSNLLHGKMYHIAHDEIEDAIMGSSNFTVRGLGLATNGNNIELNLEVDSNRDRRDLKAWFDELWNDTTLVEDVKQEVLQYLEQLYPIYRLDVLPCASRYDLVAFGLAATQLLYLGVSGGVGGC